MPGLCSLWAHYLLYLLRRWDRERPDWYSVCMSLSSYFVQTHVCLFPRLCPSAYRTGWGNSTHEQASREGSTNPAEETRTTRGHPFPRRKVEYGSTQSWTCLGLVWTILEGKEILSIAVTLGEHRTSQPPEGQGTAHPGLHPQRETARRRSLCCLCLLSPLFSLHPEVKQVPSVCHTGLGC